MTRRGRIATIASAVALFGTVLLNEAAAQGMTIDQYRHPETEKDLNFNKAYLTGIKDGLTAYNMSVEDKLFCLSGDLPFLSFEQANDLMMSWARKRGPDSGGTSVNRTLLTALRERYPCRASAR
jgi:molybdopterin-guanine dinucleotide biosynthesis protein A